jgi:hypothetical protein
MIEVDSILRIPHHFGARFITHNIHLKQKWVFSRGSPAHKEDSLHLWRKQPLLKSQRHILLNPKMPNLCKKT